MNLLLATFFVTGFFDAVLQIAKHGRLPLLTKIVGESDWYVSLTKEDGYFDRHTPLAAVLLAGTIAILTQIIILHFVNFPNKLPAIKFFVLTFVISALFGLLMKASGLFPVIADTYYKDLGVFRSMVTDGYSGVIVNATLFVIGSLLRTKWT